MLPVSLRLPYETLNILFEQANKNGMSVGTYIRTQIMKTVHNPVNTLSPTSKVSNGTPSA
ncbi:hypothetical protein MBLL_00689 (plasmid) [Methylobacterium bullatum]|uniref:Uncharacterized protein n=1 Tax=Methylobacterium bullatum TaxID=570505 RepID=A0A679JRZ6_9HYPH|nr:hypothetical protein MBLL_00689 [Methylobacterium bullatum]